MILIHPDSHLDHNLTMDHLRFILKNFGNRDGFFMEEVDLIKNNLAWLPSALYGPLAGDPEICEPQVFYGIRGDRKGRSRMIQRPTRIMPTMVVTAGPHDGFECVLFTAYGGPVGAPKEPWDCEEGSKEQEESEDFWSKHALAPE